MADTALRRGRVLAAVTAATAVCGALAGCSPSTPSASATAASFVRAWNAGDEAGMAKLAYRSGPGFGAEVTAVTAGLHATGQSHRLGQVQVHGGSATAALTDVYQLPGAGPWTVTTSLSLSRHSGRWYVDWQPAAAAPGLGSGQHLGISYAWPPRADITGAGGVSLTPETQQVVVGVEGSRVKDPAALTPLLVAAGASPQSVSAALTEATAHPSFFVPVVTLTVDQYAKLGGNTGALHAAPGTVFEHKSAVAPLSPGLSQLVGTVGPVTAEELTRLGPPYDASSQVGQNGLEALYEKQLAGSPGVTVTALDGAGHAGSASATLASFPARPGTAVATSIDPTVEAAAETAISASGGGALSGDGTLGLVAMRISTGEVLGAVSLPATSQFDEALDGEFPPGSTFKVLTTTALVQAGLSPSSPASCPPSLTVDGKVFNNAEGDKPVSTLLEAFTESCNTAFIQLADAHLHASDFPAVARLYGLGSAPQLGLPVFGGRVPLPSDGAALAATSIGQSGVVLSPLNMATVAAAVASGTVHSPRLVAGAPADTAPAISLPAPVVSALRPMMASVVTTGTAAGTGLPSGTFAKTGTAEYGSGNPLPTDAWLMGWRGDVAFAMVVHDSKGNGGPEVGPVIARFLDALPSL